MWTWGKKKGELTKCDLLKNLTCSCIYRILSITAINFRVLHHYSNTARLIIGHCNFFPAIFIDKNQSLFSGGISARNPDSELCRKRTINL